MQATNAKPQPKPVLPSAQGMVNYRKRVAQVSTPLEAANNVEKIQITSQKSPFDGKCFTITAYRPQNINPNKPLPTIFMIQGTGFIANLSTQVQDNTCSLIASLSGQQVINIPHRLAPEYLHPLPIIESAIHINFCKQHTALNIDHNNISGCGYSSGGFLLGWLANLGILQEQFYMFPLLNLSYSTDNCTGLFPEKDSMPAELLNEMIDRYTLAGTSQEKLRQHSPLHALLNNPHYKYIITGDCDRMAASNIGFCKKSTNTELNVLKNCNHFAPIQKEIVIRQLCAKIRERAQARLLLRKEKAA